MYIVLPAVKNNIMKNYYIIVCTIFVFLSGICKSYSQPDDSLVIDYSYINSLPQSARVYLNDTLIGETPVRFFPSIVDTSGKNEIKIKKDGYYDFILTFDKTTLPINKTIYLTGKAGNLVSTQEKRGLANRETYFKTPRKIFPIAVSSILTAGSGIMSFYFKQLANDKYDEYQLTGDASLLDKKRKYDIISGISLAVFQIGIAGLIYFLIID